MLSKEGIDAVLVGGACVSIYSENRYQSYDLDFVCYEELKRIENVLSKLGFKRIGRCFSHEKCLYLIDFVNPPVAIGRESIKVFEKVTTSSGTLQLLTPTDCVKDRLSSFFHWNDEQALEQALMVAKSHTINLEDIKRWAGLEGYSKKLDDFLTRIN